MLHRPDSVDRRPVVPSIHCPVNFAGRFATAAELDSGQTPPKTAGGVPAGQRGGSPSGRNQSSLSDVSGSGWADASDWLGPEVTISTS